MSWLKLFGVKKAEETSHYNNWIEQSKHDHKQFTYVNSDNELRFIAERPIHHVIREARTSQGITQVFLAKKCGISETYLRKIESGVDEPSLNAIKKIATALNTPLTFTITPE